MKTIMMILMITLSSCATTLSERGKEVRILRNSDADRKCAELGSVIGGNAFDIGLDSKINQMRDKAADMGADTVVMSPYNGGDIVSGTAFKCS